MTTYAFRHRERYKGVKIDIRAHSEEDLLNKVQQKKSRIDAMINADISKTTSARIGDIGEFSGMASFAKAGFIVSKPLTINTKYDFIADFGGTLYRIQVKTTKKENNYGDMVFSLSSSTTSKGKWKSTKYTKQDVDAFYLYCVENGWEGLYIPNEREYVRTTITVAASHKENSTKYRRGELDFNRQISKLMGKFLGK